MISRDRQKKIWQWFVRRYLNSSLVVLRYVPFRLAHMWGNALGTLGYVASKRYRTVANRNLTIAYGDQLTQWQRRFLTLRVFRNFSMGVVEFLKSPHMSYQDVSRRVKMPPFDMIDEARARGKGLILITPHMGNWEMLARLVSGAGYPLMVVSRHTEDRALNELTDKLRKQGGYEVYPRGGSVRRLFQHLKQNGVLAILPDQKADEIMAPFFGTPAPTTAGPAVIALKTGAPIVPMFSWRLPDGKYQVTIGPEIDTTSTGDHNADVLRIMTEINQLVEDAVRRHPDQWLWLHDRWRPPVKLIGERRARGIDKVDKQEAHTTAQ